MDSVTQIVLGAAVGEATLGHRVGRKAAAWGAFFGTLPDLDVLANPFLDAAQSLAFHRGVSHSFVFAVVAAPLLGMLLARWHARDGVGWRPWAWLVGLCIVTHFLLDLFTVYGTQIFWPFTDRPFGLDAVFIIDPLYTIPLAVCVVAGLVRRPGRRLVAAGLLLSTGYLGWSLAAKSLADRAFRDGFERDGVRVERMMSGPAPLNTILWTGMAQSGDTLWVATWSLFDDDLPDPAIPLARRTDLLAGHLEDRAVARLDWFSKGWWMADSSAAGRAIVDPRFGRSDLFLGSGGDYTFRFELIPDVDGRYHTFSELAPSIDDPGAGLRAMWQRMIRDL